MRTRYVSLLVLLAVAVWAPGSVLADTWGEPINTPDRFIVLTSFNNQAVFDKETGLIWEQSPDTNPRNWFDAQALCNKKTVGNRKGWRLPTIQELASLIDPSVFAPPSILPPLPPGHPFNVQPLNYWSATTFASDSSFAWLVNFFGNGFVGAGGKTNSLFVWCVRGGQGVNPQ